MAYSCIQGPGSLRLCDPHNHRNVGSAFLEDIQQQQHDFSLGLFLRKPKLLFQLTVHFSSFQTQIEYNGKLYDVEIVDTAGQEEFSSFRDSSVATGDAFLVLFAINSTSSWHELKDLRSKIIQDRQLSSTIPMVLVANKLVSYSLFPCTLTSVCIFAILFSTHFFRS